MMIFPHPRHDGNHDDYSTWRRCASIDKYQLLRGEECMRWEEAVHQPDAGY